MTRLKEADEVTPCETEIKGHKGHKQEEMCCGGTHKHTHTHLTAHRLSRQSAVYSRRAVSTEINSVGCVHRQAHICIGPLQQKSRGDNKKMSSQCSSLCTVPPCSFVRTHPHTHGGLESRFANSRHRPTRLLSTKLTVPQQHI